MEFEMLAIWNMAIWYNQNSKLLTYENLPIIWLVIILFAAPGREGGEGN